MPKKQIYLTGFMGTGKSMILNCLHEVCGFDKIEMDEQIVQEQGMSETAFSTSGSIRRRGIRSSPIFSSSSFTS